MATSNVKRSFTCPHLYVTSLWAVCYGTVTVTVTLDRQTELTGNGALDAGMLRVFTVGCGLLALLFQLLSLYYSVNNKFKKLRSLELFF